VQSYFLRVVVRAVHKFDFKLVMNETHNKWRPVHVKLRHAVIETHVYDRSYIFSPSVVASVNGLYPHCAGQMHSLG
jgi:hypothetical protein